MVSGVGDMATSRMSQGLGLGAEGAAVVMSWIGAHRGRCYRDVFIGGGGGNDAIMAEAMLLN